MKPLARWTIGPVSTTGNQILRKSIKIFQKIYPEFDVIICCNYIEDTSFLENIGVEIHKQNDNELGYPLLAAEVSPRNKYGMAASGWKLSPPRLRMESYELWLDNDIIIHDRINDIDNWLNSNSCIVSNGRGRNYGIYHSLIPNNIKLCAGFFGLPPYFDFKEAILEYCDLLSGSPLGGYNEQGLVSAILMNCFTQPIITNEIKIYEPNESLSKTAFRGYHFVCANKNTIHKPYNTYCISNFL